MDRPDHRLDCAYNFDATRIVPRDLLPLPLLPEVLPKAGRCRGRRGAQRLSRVTAKANSVNDLAWALNELNGQGHLDPRHRPSEAQFASLARLIEAVEHDSPPLDCPTPQAALAELLGSRADSYDPALAKIATYRSDLVSWPASAGRASLVDCLAPHERSLLTTESRTFEGINATEVFWGFYTQV